MHSLHSLEDYFLPYRANIIGNEQCFASPTGRRKIVYADWTASGRGYRPIEESLQKEVLPYFANTHTETTVTGAIMSRAYEQAKLVIKEHVHAREDDILIFCGSGMTAAVGKLQRIMGLRLPERVMAHADGLQLDEASRPLVLVSHMEHHSNHISWLETIATVEVIRPCGNGNIDLDHLRQLLEQYKDRKNKIAAVTACSNVTGLETPYHAIAAMMHAYDGLCFVDFACSAPYVTIDMHPGDAGSGDEVACGADLDGVRRMDDAACGTDLDGVRRMDDAACGTDLDAIYFSGHKFLGGPGTPGVLIFNRKLYHNQVPDQPGGGTILYSNPWKVHEYVASIEQREDGGTPPILQGIKAAMCIRLKEEMGVVKILEREEEIVLRVFDRLLKMPRVEILGECNRKRLGVVSFMVEGAHYGLVVKMLNDRFGVQARGGCSCAGTYGHWLLGIEEGRSYEILELLKAGEMWYKPGWVRLSVHPTMTNAEIDFILEAVEMTVNKYEEWSTDYEYDAVRHEYIFNGWEAGEMDWFCTSRRYY